MHAQKIPFIYLTIRNNKFSKTPDGQILHAIYLAVSHKRKIRYLNSGIKIRADQFQNGLVINHPAEKELNIKLAEMIQNLHSFIYINQLFDLYPQEILDRYTVSQDNTTSFAIYTRQIADTMLRSGKYSTGTSLHQTLKALDKAGIKIVSFSDLTFNKLTEISMKWSGLGLKENSQGIYFRNIRLVYNRAIIEGIARLEDYPFKRFRIPRKKNAKRNILVPDIMKLIAAKLSPGKSYVRDLFMLSLYLVGANYKDLLTAGRDQVVNGRFVYNRAKTGALISIKIEPEAMEILKRYQGKDLLLNFLENMVTGSARKQPDYFDLVQRSNRQLKAIATGCGINAPLSTYYARHTWATIAAHNGISRDVIGLALGHSSPQVTELYIEWDQELIDHANRVVLDAILFGG